VSEQKEGIKFQNKMSRSDCWKRDVLGVLSDQQKDDSDSANAASAGRLLKTCDAAAKKARDKYTASHCVF